MLGITIDLVGAFLLGAATNSNSFAAEMQMITAKIQELMGYLENQDFANLLLHGSLFANQVTDFLENFTTYLPKCYELYNSLTAVTPTA